MRPTAAIVKLIVFLDLLLLFAIVPLLPAYQRTLHLSKAQAGIVVAAYSAAVLVASVPVGHWADRLGAKRTTVAGVALLGVATLVFGVANSFWVLVAARAGQGTSSAVSWSAGIAWLSADSQPSERGRRLGGAMAAANLGALLGPLAGGPLGGAYGIRTPFVVMGVAGLLLAAAAALAEPPPVRTFEHLRLRQAVAVAVARGPFLGALVIMLLVAAVSGTLETLVPLGLGHHGYSAGEITAVLTAGGVVSVAANRVAGRAFDRVGGVPVALIAMGGTVAALVVLSAGVSAAILAAVFVGVTPFITSQYAVAFPLCAVGAENAGMGQAVAFGLLNLAWGAGFAVGPAAGAAIASASSDRLTYAILGVLTCVVAARLRWLALEA
jgi:MFS transporter, DHA1 family, solute carrier family 18 (vesicular amine transporter), member 1/2